jgi:hypothetical protein
MGPAFTIGNFVSLETSFATHFPSYEYYVRFSLADTYTRKPHEVFTRHPRLFR